MGAPARREPVDGTENTMRVSLGFEPAWFHKRCGLDFSERWHKNPHYRHGSLKTMKKSLVEAFPSVNYWNTEFTDDLATVSGIYGAYVIPQVFGINLRYSVDRWPTLEPGNGIKVKEIECLKVNKLLQGPFVIELFEQMDIIESEWGKIHGYLNWQGVLNIAFQLCGQRIFLDMYDKPDLVHQFFSIICEVIIRLAKKVQEKQRKSGFYINQFSVGNCTVNMISPDMYEKFVFPYDKKIAHSFERFGVHTCNWDITPYIDVLKKLPKLGYLDMGIMSDLARVKELFKHTRRAVMYSPVALHDLPINCIRKDMEKIYNELAPCDIVMGDIRADTPDIKVNKLLEVCSILESA
jgi:hypothetical protein